MIPKKPAPDLIRGGSRFSERSCSSKKCALLRFLSDQALLGATNELRPVGGAASRNHVPDDGGIGGRVVRGLSIRTQSPAGQRGQFLFLRRPSRVYHHLRLCDMDKSCRPDL